VEKDHEKIKICRNGKPIALPVPLEAHEGTQRFFSFYF